MSASTLVAQSAGVEFITVEVDGLTPDTFKSIYHAFEQANSAKIERACIPAGILLFKKLSASTSFNDLQSVITASDTAILAVRVSTLDVEGFDERCMQVRHGQ